MSYFDDKAEKDLVTFGIYYEKLEQTDHDRLVVQINQKFQFTGSKIAWSSFLDSISYSKNNADKAFLEISKKQKILKLMKLFLLETRPLKVHTRSTQ